MRRTMMCVLALFLLCVTACAPAAAPLPEAEYLPVTDGTVLSYLIANYTQLQKDSQAVLHVRALDDLTVENSIVTPRNDANPYDRKEAYALRKVEVLEVVCGEDITAGDVISLREDNARYTVDGVEYSYLLPVHTPLNKGSEYVLHLYEGNKAMGEDVLSIHTVNNGAVDLTNAENNTRPDIRLKTLVDRFSTIDADAKRAIVEGFGLQPEYVALKDPVQTTLITPYGELEIQYERVDQRCYMTLSLGRESILMAISPEGEAALKALCEQ